MSSYVKLIYDRLEFLEFKQNVLFLKQPQHKTTVFFELTLEEFIKIRDFNLEFENKIKEQGKSDIFEYEKKLFEISPNLKSYPSSSYLVSKILMSKEVFNLLFSQ